MKNLEIVKENIGFYNSFDFTERLIKNDNLSFVFLYNTTLSKIDIILSIVDKFVKIKDKITKENYKDILYNEFGVSSIVETKNKNLIIDVALNGDLVLFSSFDDVMFYFETIDAPKRSISEPDSEKVVRGSRDGFTEDLRVNIALIRKRIKSKHLVLKKFEIGEYTKTCVLLIYLDDVIKENTLLDIQSKLENLKVKELTLTDKALEELLVSKKITAYPLVKYSERPDTLAMQLYQGMFGILVDTSPCAILGPVSVFDHLQHAEEFRQTVISGTYLRLIRIIGIIIAFFSVPLWFALSNINFKHPLFENLFNPNIDYNFLFIQLIIALVGIELIRMASIHTPNALSTSMGLVSGIILGDMAVSVGLVSTQVVILSAISAIGSYITPSYELSLANKMASLFLTIIVYFFKIPGLIIGTILLALHLACLKSFNRPYLYPLIPFNFKDLIKQLVRIPYVKKEKVRKK